MPDPEEDVQTGILDLEMRKYTVFWDISKLNILVAAASNRESEMATLALTRLGTIIEGGAAITDQMEVWCLLFVLNRGGILCKEDPWSDMADTVHIPTDTNILSIEVLESPVEVPDVSLLSIEVLETPVEIPVEVPPSIEVLETPVEIPVEVPPSIEVLETLVEIPVEVPLSIEVLETPVEIPVEVPPSIEVLETLVEIPVEVPLSIEVLETPVTGDQSALTLMQSSYEEDQLQFDAEISAMLNC
jgi:hypothetical protein